MSKFASYRIVEMKLKTRILTLSVGLLVLASLTACDQVRKLAGRPTSADIELIRERIAKDKAREKEIEDSIRLAIAAAEKAKADSVAACDSFAAMPGYIRTPERVRGIKSGSADHRFYVAVGAFKSPENAQRLAAKFDAETYKPTVVFTGSGLNVVLVCPTDKVQEAFSSFKMVKQNPLCPKEAWVLVNDVNWNKK